MTGTGDKLVGPGLSLQLGRSGGVAAGLVRVVTDIGKGCAVPRVLKRSQALF